MSPLVTGTHLLLWVDVQKPDNLNHIPPLTCAPEVVTFQYRAKLDVMNPSMFLDPYCNPHITASTPGGGDQATQTTDCWGFINFINFLLFLSTLAFNSPPFIILIELQPITLQSRREWGVHLTGASVGVPLQSTLLQDAQPQSQN